MADQNGTSWWHTVPGVLTATAALITAIGGLLTVMAQAGLLDREPEAPNGHVTEVSAAPPASTVVELEQRLEAANIELSTGTSDDVSRVRGYMAEPGSAYRILAQGCLDVLQGRRLRRPGYLDMIDKRYTMLVGQEHYLDDSGALHLDRLREAMVHAQNEYHGGSAATFAEILTPPPGR